MLSAVLLPRTVPAVAFALLVLGVTACGNLVADPPPERGTVAVAGPPDAVEVVLAVCQGEIAEVELFEEVPDLSRSTMLASWRPRTRPDRPQPLSLSAPGPAWRGAPAPSLAAGRSYRIEATSSVSGERLTPVAFETSDIKDLPSEMVIDGRGRQNRADYAAEACDPR